MTAEQFIKDYTRTDSNELIAIEDIHGKTVISYREWLTPEQALRAVEIARKETIDKAWEYINNQLNLPSDFEQHFRKAMEE